MNDGEAREMGTRLAARAVPVLGSILHADI